MQATLTGRVSPQGWPALRRALETAEAAARERGCTAWRVLRDGEDPDQLAVQTEWGDPAAARRFLEGPGLALPEQVLTERAVVFWEEARGEKRRVRDAMRTELACCPEATPLGEVARRMRREGASAVAVGSHETCCRGIITEMDLVWAYHHDQRQLTAGMLMSPAPAGVPDEESLAAAARLMVEKGVHRLLVFDPRRENRPVGIIAAEDIVADLARGGGKG